MGSIKLLRDYFNGDRVRIVSLCLEYSTITLAILSDGPVNRAEIIYCNRADLIELMDSLVDRLGQTVIGVRGFKCLGIILDSIDPL